MYLFAEKKIVFEILVPKILGYHISDYNFTHKIEVRKVTAA
jgi:hypothetical protein